MGILTYYAREENKIPKILPNLAQTDKKLQAGRVNTSFIHNFLGFRVWKHMNNSMCWMTKSDLDPMKNLNNVEKFDGYVKYFFENQSDLWRHLLVNGELSINTNTV